MLVVANAVRAIYHRFLASKRANDNVYLLYAFYRSIRVNIFISVPSALFLIIFGSRLFPILFSPDLAGAEFYAEILFPAVAMRMLAVSVDSTFLVFQRQFTMTLLQLFHVSMLLGGYYLVALSGALTTFFIIQSVVSCIVYATVVLAARKIILTM
jgi:O-antigen/teichoic acid export membrane protein